MKHILNTGIAAICQEWLSFGFFFAILIGCISIVSCVTAHGVYQQERVASEPVQASLLMENKSVQPGAPFWVALRVKLESGWHTYWKNPGETGIACSIDWFLPEGFKASSCHWPAPQRFTENGLNYFGYEGEFALLAELIPPADLKPNQKVELGATLRWVACNQETCLPGDSDVNLAVPVLADVPEDNAINRGVFTDTRKCLPKSDWRAEAQRRREGVIELNLFSPSEQNFEISSIDFFPEHPDCQHGPVSLVSATNGVYRLNIAESSASGIEAADLQGVVLFKRSSNMQEAVSIHIPVADLGVTEMGIAPPFEGGLLLALLFAFLGGAILNLMPCVLPVISVKILHLIKIAKGSRRSIFRYGLAFTAGILVSFWVLAGLLLLLQAYGHSVGWGFQLQEPLFVAFLAALLFVFSLSLFGVFELGTLFASWAGQRESESKKGSNSLTGAFLGGVLATAVATPCTGPFLGSAIGFAVTLPPLSALVIFSAIGLGMSVPYLVLTCYPSLINWLPRPGLWMVRFKHVLGFLMVGTVLWLIWVFAAQTSIPSVMMLLVALFVMTIACWIYGEWSRPSYLKRTHLLTTLCTAILLFFSGCIIVEAASLATPGIEVGVDENGWQPFSRELLEKAHQEGKPVFVDFTAKWCLICQANGYVLELEKVRERFEQEGVVKLLADWTKYDPFITEELRKQGRNGVPLYLLYAPHRTEPYVLPQLLTPDVVLKYLNTALQSDV